jgi:hypothetical protein
MRFTTLEFCNSWGPFYTTVHRWYLEDNKGSTFGSLVGTQIWSRKPRLRPQGSVTLTTRHPLYPQRLALTLPTSGGCSVGTVRSRTKATELVSGYAKSYMFSLYNQRPAIYRKTMDCVSKGYADRAVTWEWTSNQYRYRMLCWDWEHAKRNP